jgi:ankyrin repeat protein
MACSLLLVIHLLSACGGSIHDAARNGNADRLRNLLRTDPALVNVRNSFQSTPLHLAADQGHAEAVKFLIESGADPNVQNKYGCSPLHLCAMWGHKSACEVIISAGSDLRCKTKQAGQSPLHLAVGNGMEEVAELLIVKGANVNEVSDLYLESPLHDASLNGQVESAKVLIENGANINARTKWGATPLHMAISALENQVEMVTFLLENGAEVNAAIDKDQITPLHKAVRKGLFDVCELLINRGADVNLKTAKGETALDIAREEGNENIVELLIRNGASD